MSKALPLKIAPEVLFWARNSAGLSVEDCARSIGVDEVKVKRWEKGIETPSYVQLENLAYKAYKRPLAILFLSRPPKEKPIDQDFRNLSSREIKNLSSELKLVIRKARHLQNLVRDLHKDEKERPPYLNFNVTLRDNPVSAAARFRNFIGLTIEEQSKWKVDYAFNNFREMVEGLGIYVFQLDMPFEEARAFSLTDDFPLVILNLKDAKNGRIFSLFHEVCHILFNSGGIFRDKESKNLSGRYKDIEDFCNQFAASFLIPEEVFKHDINFNIQSQKEWSEEDLEKFARKYKVSKEVILRKLVDLRLATKSFYFSKKGKWNAELFGRKQALLKKVKEEGRKVIISPADTVYREKGKKFINDVMSGVEKGILTYSEIADYLDVKLDHLPKIIQRIQA
ncbi:MAG: ImmA/IrrE family metallo-endopeptidase [Chitinophagales bacterium]|nr:ImmA/IrrE family metallo-endopeptidase [Chitinophagales bacterium]